VVWLITCHLPDYYQKKLLSSQISKTSAQPTSSDTDKISTVAPVTEASSDVGENQNSGEKSVDGDDDDDAIREKRDDVANDDENSSTESSENQVSML
jgi:hypothetical protein